MNTNTKTTNKPANKPLNAAARKAIRVSAIAENNQVLESYALGSGASHTAAILAAKRNFALMLKDTSNTTAAIHLAGIAARLGGVKYERAFDGVPSLENINYWIAALRRLTEHVTAKRSLLVARGALKSVQGAALLQLDSCMDALTLIIERQAVKAAGDSPVKPKIDASIS